MNPIPCPLHLWACISVVGIIYLAIYRTGCYITLDFTLDNFWCYLSSLFLAVEYSRIINHHCVHNGYNIVFSKLDAAKATCSMDGNCVGVYDNCGRGNAFALCAAPLNIGDSSCGSILHQYKFNYQKFKGKGINSNGKRYISCTVLLPQYFYQLWCYYNYHF